MSKDFAAMLMVYGLFLVVCGTAGAWLHNWEKKAMHSVYAGQFLRAAIFCCQGRATREVFSKFCCWQI
eukprot:Skav207530  [mRNA]  locus=scaffold756:10351:11752:- [translate_table: standard]